MLFFRFSLGRQTWFTSAMGLDYGTLGKEGEDGCSCHSTGTCIDDEHTCNCDVGTSKSCGEGNIWNDSCTAVRQRY